MATYNGHNEDASGNILLSIGNGMTATLETGTTASQAYTKGAYLYYNNRLCKVTAAIASGNTLTIGTNIAYTSLGAELTSHLKATNGDEFYFDYKDGEPGYYPSASKTASQFVPIGGSASVTSAVVFALNRAWTSAYTVPSTYNSKNYIFAAFSAKGTHASKLKINGTAISPTLYISGVTRETTVADTGYDFKVWQGTLTTGDTFSYYGENAFYGYLLIL